jgi:RluA family pseudouridine synthase
MKPDVSIVFEDDAVIAFNKPAGLLVAPDRWDKGRENLMGFVHDRLSPEYFNAHRIDRDTSGLVLCAKTKSALDGLCRQFEQHEVVKEYLALTRGAPADRKGVVTKPIAPDEHTPGRMKVSGHGKPCETGYELVARWSSGRDARFAQLRCTPRTGRTHQIRVHLAWLGCPIVADRLYGDGRGVYLSEIKRKYKQKAAPERPLIGRLALHAEGLTFTHPATGARMTLTAPLPKDFEVAIKYLCRFAGEPPLEGDLES